MEGQWKAACTVISTSLCTNRASNDEQGLMLQNASITSRQGEN